MNNLKHTSHSRASTEIVGLQHLRGLAAVAVVFAHSSGISSLDHYFGQPALDNFLIQGARGVDLFFTISGFIVCVIAFNFRISSVKIDGWTFLARRAVRILPLMWLAILSYAALRLLSRGTFPWPHYLNATFLVPFGVVEPNQIWTLRHEAIFYLVFSLSFLFAMRARWLIVIWCVLPLGFEILSYHPTEHSFLGIMGSPVNVEFGVGFCIGLLWMKRSRGLVLPTPVPAVLVLTGLMIAYMLISQEFSLDFQIRSVIVSCVICSIILFCGIHIKTSSGSLERFAKLLGDASYSIYLFHPHFISAIVGFAFKFDPTLSPKFVIWTAAIFSIAVSIGIHLTIERPLLRFSHRALSSTSFRRA